MICLSFVPRYHDLPLLFDPARQTRNSIAFFFATVFFKYTLYIYAKRNNTEKRQLHSIQDILSNEVVPFFFGSCSHMFSPDHFLF